MGGEKLADTRQETKTKKGSKSSVKRVSTINKAVEEGKPVREGRGIHKAVYDSKTVREGRGHTQDGGGR